MNKHTVEMITRLTRAGIESDDAHALRRIAMTLHRWSERECNGEIERDEVTGKTYAVYGQNGPGKISRYRTADRERGAQKRLIEIMARYPSMVAYLQGDPRGAPLYVIPRAQLGDRDVSAYYSSVGIAVHS